MNSATNMQKNAAHDESLIDALPLSLFLVKSGYTLHPINAHALALRETHAFFAQSQLSDKSPLGRWLIALLDNTQKTKTSISDTHIFATDFMLTHQSISAWVSYVDADETLICLDIKNHVVSHSDSTASAALMTAMLAHEIRNPLLAISGAAQLLKNAGAQEALCQLILHETARIEQLLKELDPLRAETPLQCALTNIHAILANAEAVITAGIGSHIRIIKHYDPSLPEINVDSASLERACINLLKNAAEACATVAQPTITLTTRYSSIKDTRAITLEIHDNGEGIAKSVASQLFHPFITTKKEGRGLGLPIVARIIEAHGGHVELVHSRKHSTLFRLTLPTHHLHNSAKPV